MQKFSEKEQTKESKKRKMTEISELAEKKHCSHSVALNTSTDFPYNISFSGKSQNGLESQSKMEELPILSSNFRMNRIIEKEPFFINDCRLFPDKPSKLSSKETDEPNLSKNTSSFIQRTSCSQIGNGVMKCMECRTQRKTLTNYCRFFGFRKLKKSEHGIEADGFTDMSDVQDEDMTWWQQMSPISKPNLSFPRAKYIIEKVGPKFLEMIEMERDVLKLKKGEKKIFWKKPCHQIREMCDVCSTTLFNLNCFCAKCGFCVCIDCYKMKAQNNSSEEEIERRYVNNSV